MADEKNIKPEDLKNKDNLVECECGNYTHHRYAVPCDDTSYSCPECHYSWLEGLIKMYKDILKETADRSLTEPDINLIIKQKQSELIGITVEEFDDLGLEI